ncbi:hypothetical protein [Brumicola pallidula]|uniref:Uncharacterized protein n=1 Tax=Brumicola pallidula DSM 14239 = ACAM 615 TaxID=1121922 RepID=K7A5F7_9ALTE|nr:hypothetical protein [Glaciecola pallidula]GAC30710.1 hypothetical protein GPAL_3870 [Glaciecola pallidula DSM 14239 = ACAM 615]
MHPQLHETTLNLISLIHFYRRAYSDNEKIKGAADYSLLLTMRGTGISSSQERLQFCSAAVEAITSLVVEGNVTTKKGKNVVSRLDREEIDFIQNMMFTDARHHTDY